MVALYLEHQLNCAPASLLSYDSGQKVAALDVLFILRVCAYLGPFF